MHCICNAVCNCCCRNDRLHCIAIGAAEDFEYASEGGGGGGSFGVNY